MSRIYFFGDSITFGTGCTPDEDYYHKMNTPDRKLWPDIVSEYFDSAKFNLASPGVSTETILKDFYSFFPDIVPGVMKVVIFKGFYDRLDLQTSKGDYKVLHQYGTNENDEYNNKHFSKEEIQLISKYGIRFLMDNSSRIRHYEDTFNYISTTLDRIGIDHIIWQPGDLDPMYELNHHNRLTIAVETEGKIKDYHFSYQGHEIFANWIIKKFNTKYNYTKNKLM